MDSSKFKVYGLGLKGAIRILAWVVAVVTLLTTNHEPPSRTRSPKQRCLNRATLNTLKGRRALAG